jgi:anti-sigma-K factor RskA
MINESDRLARAGHYVLGLMDDEERERAERDLERDGAFRDAVLRIAERMHVLEAGAAPDAGWRAISERIAQMPQMRDLAPAGLQAAAPKITDAQTDVRRIGLHSIAGRRTVIVAAGLIAAFALGYVTGVSSNP